MTAVDSTGQESCEGIYGVEAGASHHFGISSVELTPEQAALLVAILPNPRKFDLVAPSTALIRKRAVILERASKFTFPIPLAATKLAIDATHDHKD